MSPNFRQRRLCPLTAAACLLGLVVNLSIPGASFAVGHGMLLPGAEWQGEEMPEAEAWSQEPRTLESTATPLKMPDARLVKEQVLKGEAAVEESAWGRHYTEGLESLKRRSYEVAEEHLQAALKEFGSLSKRDSRYLKTRLALAEVYRATERYGESDKAFAECLIPAKRAFGAESSEVAQCLFGLSLVNVIKGHLSRADALCREALSIREKVFGANSRQVGLTCNLLGTILARQGWTSDAEVQFRKSIELMEKDSNAGDIDLADGLRSMAFFLQAHGRNAEAAPLFKRMFVLKEQAMRFDQPSSISGAVTVHWDRGSPEARELLEGKYPVEYLNVNGLRVATMVVDLGYRLGVLISIRNNTNQRTEIGVGPVALDTMKPKAARILPVVLDPSLKVMEERHFAWLTRGQPFVCNVLITRKTAAFLPNGLPDLRHNLGGNIFGMYGEWGLITSSEANARKYGYARAELMQESSAGESSYLRSMNFIPTMLEAGESRTGLLFFRNPLFQEGVLRVMIGNTTLKFPFKGPVRYSPI